MNLEELVRQHFWWLPELKQADSLIYQKFPGEFGNEQVVIRGERITMWIALNRGYLEFLITPAGSDGASVLWIPLVELILRRKIISPENIKSVGDVAKATREAYHEIKRLFDGLDPIALLKRDYASAVEIKAPGW